MVDHIPYPPRICPRCDGHLEYYGKDEEGETVWYCLKCDSDVTDFDTYLKNHSTEY